MPAAPGGCLDNSQALVITSEVGVILPLGGHCSLPSPSRRFRSLRLSSLRPLLQLMSWNGYRMLCWLVDAITALKPVRPSHYFVSDFDPAIHDLNV